MSINQLTIRLQGLSLSRVPHWKKWLKWRKELLIVLVGESEVAHKVVV